MERIRVGRAWFDNLTMDECLGRIREGFRKKRKNFMVTANVDNVLILEQDAGFRAAYEAADMLLADGMPLIWASRILGSRLKEKISGSDLVPRLCRQAAEDDLSIFLLGAAAGVAEKAAARIRAEWGGLRVAGMYSPPLGFETNNEENRKIVRMINQAGADILLAAFGAPKQEKWIHAHFHELEIGLAIGVGATFDFVAGTKKRAPLLWQKAGTEWFWRFLQEPRRLFKRYFIDDLFPFTFLILKQLLEK
jgi:N-acetylglucosaminyldiphosphoundecaprenol N-acetyl-beta-D-mannosaminyltransferase